MAVLEDGAADEGFDENEAHPSFMTRQQERNRKKKLKKKASKQRKRAGGDNQDAQTSDSVTSNSGSVSEAKEKTEEVPRKEYPVFELTGPFERFKLVFDESGDGRDGATDGDRVGTDFGLTGDPFKTTPDQPSLKARTAALLAEEAAARAKKSEKKSDRKGVGDDDDDDANREQPLSKKKLKLLNRPSVASLKQAAARPDVVEMWDVCAKDPLLLVYLKSYRNTVPVPKHWCAKRKYLQGKRGFEKPPFRLPEFIARTGIMEMRQTVSDKDAEKSLKTRMREKIRPKIGKVDIDYRKLHDAFFKYQTKPKLTSHGDLYYEGKEFEVKLKEKKPGNLSDELRTALGLPTGPNADRYPPPWLIAMQRYGPPPSYPNVVIPGLNAPIPPGCAFGYHPGGWGKPPVDEMGRPIYGDVFGNGGNMAGVPPPPPPTGGPAEPEEPVISGLGKSGLWGELESDEEEEEEEDESEEDEDKTGEAGEGGGEGETVGLTGPPTEMIQPIEKVSIDLGGLVTPASGLITPSGAVSSVIGAETPAAAAVGAANPSNIELRKRTIEAAMDNADGFETPAPGTGLAAGQLYRVLPERETALQPSAMLGSTRVYDVTGVTGAPRGEEAEDPREKMLRKRLAGAESQQKTGTVSSSGTTSTGGPPAAKKYKDFKF
ncbi:Splicing factor 3B subunit 2 [Echinococcus granulosus]|uniref:Splicing factor 3B subunit 2 n=1 Tax=Echinococcus granulosus TaxID=6210 RepID=U6JEK1_ECHGR|nr:Splicing factor 3B subunit 2 [Echinococcus granulosus]EUB61189.1 Splicing factor 3B subunit 2 [Echinococcus granulosus]KAH9278945.1 Splicing factor 3B subunit 2 [Echinococcus granulosus]CDS20876.1 splicing factor 3b subunit 2 [Echinococcus granulosus]